ncbi:MAG: hypothetical protein ACQEQL_02020 [Pseudomonadota bacterium]
MTDPDTQQNRNILTLSAASQDALKALDRFYLTSHQDYIFKAGLQYLKHLIDDVINSCDRSDLSGFNPLHNQMLYEAVVTAREAGAPDGLIKAAIDLARQGYEGVSGFDALLKIYYDIDPSTARLELTFEDAAVEAAVTGRDARRDISRGHMRAQKLWHKSHEYQWQGCDIALRFNPSIAPETMLVEIDMSCFVTAEGEVLEADLKNFLAEQLRAGVLDFSPVNLGAAVLKLGVEYNSPAGYQSMMALSAILSAVSVLAAVEQDSQPRAKAAPDMMDQLEGWLQRFTTSFITGPKRPPVFRPDQIPLPQVKVLIKKLQQRCAEALLKTVPARLPRIGIDDAASLAYAPVIQPIVYLPNAEGSGFEKRLDPLFTARLGQWGYSEKACNTITKHCLGHASLKGAPYINIQTLREKGLYQAQLDTIESGIAQVSDIRHMFNKWVLGEEFCQKILGLSSDQLNNPLFDILAGLGFTQAEIKAANLYCCGAGRFSGAPDLSSEHARILDQHALEPVEEINLQAALQAVLTGEVALGIAVTHDFSIEDMKDLSFQAWGAGLRYCRLVREKSGWDAPLLMSDFDQADKTENTPVQNPASDVA